MTDAMSSARKLIPANAILFGTEGCGKSVLIRSLLQGLNARQTSQNIYELPRRDVSYMLKVVENDTSAQLSSKEASIVLLCYDISSPTSLRIAQQYWHAGLVQALPTAIDQLPIMLVGLKRDLRTSDPCATVDIEEALQVGQEMRITLYAECSAKTGELMKQVAEDFLQLLKTAITSKDNDSFSYCIVS